MNEGCPENCPHLQKEGDMYLCDLFGGALRIAGEKPLRCADCLNDVRRKDQTQKRGLFSHVQMFRRKLDFIKDFSKIKITEGKDRQRFSKVLKGVGETFPNLLDRQKSSLLMNVFLVLDNTEKDQMISILQNPRAAESFVKKITSMSRGDNFIKDVRREMDDYTAQIERQKQLQRQQILSPILSRRYQRTLEK